MSWEKFQEDAFNLTKKEANKLRNIVLSNYRQAIKTIDFNLKNQYAKILTGINPKNYYNEMIKHNRLDNLLKQVKYDYTLYSKKNETIIQKLLRLFFSNTFYRKYYAANWLSKKPVFAILPEKLIELTVYGTNEAWKNISKSMVNRFGDKTLYLPRSGTLKNLLAYNRAKELRSIQNAITQNLIQGKSYTQSVSSIRDLIGREYKQGKIIKYTGSKANALRIIRTESNRIMNSASFAASQSLETDGVDVKRQLQAVLDNRTRGQSARMDGQRVGVNEPFKYPGGVRAMTPGTTGVAKYDINDRETVIDIINGESPSIRRGRNPKTGKNEVFEYKGFDTWAKENGLTKNVYGEYILK
ncbi:MAG: phage minor head protein [Ignavibacteria bacterium]|jgi:hypothetical protein